MSMYDDVENLINFIQKYENVPIPNLDEFNQGILDYHEKILDIRFLAEEEKKEIFGYLIEHVDHFQELLQIYIYSVLAYFFEGGPYVDRILELTENNPVLVEENRYFIYNQIQMYAFRWEKSIGRETSWRLRMMYRDIYHSYRKQLGIKPAVVSVKKRNRMVVVFLISQYLNEMHGPTKTVLDRCEVIAEKMGATPVIINTAELGSRSGYIPYFQPLFGSYLEHMQNTQKVTYRGREFPYIQCSKIMPNPKEMAGILQMVLQLNPYCIIQIGGNSICADLCSNFYPLITVGTVPSSLMTSEGQFLLKGRPVTEADKEYIRKLGFSDNYLQYCMFTSSFNEQKTHFSRAQYGIPEDAFTAIIVGVRLDYEINDHFIEGVLIPIMEQGIVPVFVGIFDDYHKFTERYPLLQEKSVFVGSIKDILAMNELCDIYVNPNRNGGGTSVVEAMAKKLPPVSLDHGDVALGAGQEFCVSSFEEMVDRIIRLRDDAEYYAEMSEKAYERMKYVTNSKGIFWEAFQRIEKLPEFQ